MVARFRRGTGARGSLSGTERKIVPEFSEGFLLCWRERPLLSGLLMDKLGDGATASLVVAPMRCEGRRESFGVESGV